MHIKPFCAAKHARAAAVGDQLQFKTVLILAIRGIAK